MGEHCCGNHKESEVSEKLSETKEEMVHQHEEQIQALIDLLIAKGIITEAELLKKMDSFYEEEVYDDVD